MFGMLVTKLIGMKGTLDSVFSFSTVFIVNKTTRQCHWQWCKLGESLYLKHSKGMQLKMWRRFKPHLVWQTQRGEHATCPQQTTCQTQNYKLYTKTWPQPTLYPQNIWKHYDALKLQGCNTNNGRRNSPDWAYGHMGIWAWQDLKSQVLVERRFKLVSLVKLWEDAKWRKINQFIICLPNFMSSSIVVDILENIVKYWSRIVFCFLMTHKLP